MVEARARREGSRQGRHFRRSRTGQDRLRVYRNCGRTRLRDGQECGRGFGREAVYRSQSRSGEVCGSVPEVFKEATRGLRDRRAFIHRADAVM